MAKVIVLIIGGERGVGGGGVRGEGGDNLGVCGGQVRGDEGQPIVHSLL